MSPCASFTSPRPRNAPRTTSGGEPGAEARRNQSSASVGLPSASRRWPSTRAHSPSPSRAPSVTAGSCWRRITLSNAGTAVLHARARTAAMPYTKSNESALRAFPGAATLGGQVRALRVRLQSQLVFRQCVAVLSRRVRAVAQLFMIGRTAGAGAHQHQASDPPRSHGFFLLPPLPFAAGEGGGGGESDGEGSSAPTAATPVSLRANMARYASTRGSSGRRSRHASHTCFAPSPSPAR